MIARFKGGPLDGDERQIEDGLTSMLAHDPIDGRPNRVIVYGLAGADVGKDGEVVLFIPLREFGDMAPPPPADLSRVVLIV